MTESLVCHICEHITDFTCDVCGEPVCEDCCVQMTLQNQIDYPLCEECYDSAQCSALAERRQEETWQEKRKQEKEKRAAVRRANYRKPENVEKRRLKKIEAKRLKREETLRFLAEAENVIRQMFRGM